MGYQVLAGSQLFRYLAASEVNTALAAGHMQNDGNVTPTLEFRRALAKEMLENTIC
jgi:hypothetical protein